MKKRTLLLTALAVFTLAMAGCQTTEKDHSVRIAKEVQANDTTVIDGTEDTSKEAIQNPTEEQAKEIALAHANVNESDITYLRIEQDTDDGVEVIDVDFYVGNKEYDYEIDAKTGDIRSFDAEIEDDFVEETKEPASKDKSIISKEKAVDIVLAKVKGATKKNVEISLDTDDGHKVYEGEILYKGMEYDFELDAKTGTILEWSKEREN